MISFKKIISLILVIGLLCTSLTACNLSAGNSSESEKPSGSQQPSENLTESESESDGDSEKESETQVETESETDSVTEVPTETETETESETESETEEFPYTFADVNKTVYAISDVNVRDLPSADGNKLGAVSEGDSVVVTGKCNETGWYRIVFGDGVGYVNTTYFADSGSSEEPPIENEIIHWEGNVSNDNPDPDEVFGQKLGSVLVIGKAGYETVGYSETNAIAYANVITYLADALVGYSNVYSLLVPKSSGIQYDDAYESIVHKTNQGTTIDKVLAKMGDNVNKIDIFDTMWEHRDDYLYFRTDHHWTQTGAYYAYAEFCKAKGIEPHLMSDYKLTVANGYVGSYYRYSEQNGVKYDPFNRYPDTVYTYTPVSNAVMTVTDKSGKSFEWPIVRDLTGKTGTYMCFIGGDNPYSIIKNKDITDGSSCIIVKESFGNAFVPFVVDHYETVHVIDARYWSGNLIDFAKENNVNDIIMINNLSAALSSTRCKDLNKVIYK